MNHHSRPEQPDAEASVVPAERPHDRWADLAAGALAAPAAAVYLKVGRRLVVRGGVGGPELPLDAPALLGDGGWCERVLDARAPALLDTLALEAARPAGNVSAALAPVLGPAGERLGVVAVLDPRARKWTEQDARRLQAVAHSVGLELRLRTETAERERAQAAVQRAEAKFAAIFENGALGAAIVGTDGWLIRTNGPLRRLLGGTEEELRGRSLAEFVHPDDQPAIRHALHFLAEGSAGYRQEELRVRGAAGRVRWASVYVSLVRDRAGRPLCGLVLLEDVTKRKAAEEALHESQHQLALSQRMEAVGRLAGGIAHDLNNVLTVIVSFAQLLELELEPGSDAILYLDEIRQAATRSATLTRQLLAFSRQQILKPQSLNLNQVVAEMSGMLRRLVKADIELVTELDPGLGTVHADPGQVEQVIMNLVVNARDAMLEGGQITIRTRNAQLTEQDAQRHPYPVRTGAYALLTVSDTGQGMDEETLARIFEPFFTTKEVGDGSGLGLSTAYGIIKQSGGYIWASSTPGQGTTFEIYLPVTDPAPATADAAMAVRRIMGGSETILLAEDEPSIRSIAQRILTRQGYTVISAENGVAALAAYEAHDGPVHLLLTDVVMPKMNGRVLAQQLLARQPSLRVLFMSGYTADAIERYGVFEPGTAFLDKPFTPDSLARLVRETLDGG